MSLNNFIVENIVKELGFDLVGFSKADELREETDRLEEWLSAGFNAGMGYMEKNLDKRKDIKIIFPGAKSVISLAKNYFVDDEFSGNDGAGKISRYAWGKDYHFVLWDKLELLIKELSRIDPEFKAKYYVDTGPVMDKAWAVKAGIGWMGKHTNVINKEIGSWFFICTIITNIEFNTSSRATDLCGTCKRCIDACPTDALVKEYVLDAGKCISYLTIENKNEIPDEFKGKLDNWIFGCDICQEVCPWNLKFSRQTDEKGFLPEKGSKELNLNDIIGMGENEFKVKFSNSPVKRPKLKGLKRNALFLKNSKIKAQVEE